VGILPPGIEATTMRCAAFMTGVLSLLSSDYGASAPHGVVVNASQEPRMSIVVLLDSSSSQRGLYEPLAIRDRLLSGTGQNLPGRLERT
jgi:hypothetical protein